MTLRRLTSPFLSHSTKCGLTSRLPWPDWLEVLSQGRVRQTRQTQAVHSSLQSEKRHAPKRTWLLASSPAAAQLLCGFGFVELLPWP